MRKKFLFLLTLFLLGIKSVWAEDLSLSINNEDISNTYNIVTNNTNFLLPKYSIKDTYNLGVRQQESDACWAYGTLASVESNMIKNGVDNKYLSVAHLEFATQNSLYVPGFINFNRTFNKGGYIENTNAYILNNWGPIYEDDMPKSLIKNVINKELILTEDMVKNRKPVVDIDNIIRIRNEQGVCDSNTIMTIKKYISTYGGMAATVYFEDLVSDYELSLASNNKYNLKHKYLNGPYYYYDGSSYVDDSNRNIAKNKTQNHMVEIIGWDDTIPASNFSTKPSRDGAWIVKNSYGESKYLVDNRDINMGDNGYYYISYDDINICGNLVGYYGVNKSVSDYAYYYDDLGYNSTVNSNNNEIYTANIFTKKSLGTERLDKVTFGVLSAGYKYTIYYAPNGALKNYIELGSGITEHKGYISYNLKENLYVSDTFSIIVKFEGNNVELPIAIDNKDMLDKMYNNYRVTKGVSYISQDGEVWSNFKSDSMNFQNPIRVYTSRTDASFDSSVDKDLELNSNDNLDIKVNTIDNKEEVKDDIPNNPQTGLISFFVVGLLVFSLIIIGKKFRRNRLFKL